MKTKLFRQLPIFIFLILMLSTTYAGQVKFDGVPVDITTADNEDLVIAPGSGGNTQIGIGSGSNTHATSQNDLHITGVLETDGAGYFDSTLTLTGAFTANGNVTLGDSTSDSITPTGRFAASLVPSLDATYALGSSALGFTYLYANTLASTAANLVLQPSTGNVGIGITSPTARLHIKTAGTSSNFALRISDSTPTDRLVVLDNGNVGIGTTAPLALLQAGTSPTPALFVKASGNVGIGTTNPATALDVNGTVTATSFVGPITGAVAFNNITSGTNAQAAMIVSTGASLNYANSGSINSSTLQGATWGAPLAIGSTTPNSGLFTTLSASGNVGIGNTAPLKLLDVSTTPGTGLIVTSAGNVGIGTTNPVNKLQVVGGIATYDGAGKYSIFSQETGFGQIQSYSSQPLYINPLGNNVVFNRDGGNVGIGTTGPNEKLEIAGATGGNGIRVTGASSNSPTLTFYNNAATTNGFQLGQGFASGIDNVGYVLNKANAALVFGTNSAEKMRIDNLGNVGIGTTGPVAKLDFGTSGASTNVIETYTSGYIKQGIANNGYEMRLFYPSTASNGVLTFGTMSVADGTTYSEKMRIQENGNVGIGITNPTARLDAGASYTQFTPVISARGPFNSNSNSFEWGHNNAAGYGSTIGYYYSAGNPYIAFNGEAGTTANTFKTRGIKSSIILSDLAGGMQFGNVATAATTDNQAFVPLVTILGIGNVGIGTAGPYTKTHISGVNTVTNGYGQLFVGSTDSQAADVGAQISLGGVYTGTTQANFGFIAAKKENATDSNYDSYLALGSNKTGFGLREWMRINSAGNVGIGTTNPLYPFQVHTATNQNFMARSSLSPTGGIMLQSVNDANSANQVLELRGSNVIMQADAGNVGIGTTAPSYTLDVRSTVSIGATNNAGAYLNILGSSTGMNWRIANQVTATGLFEITPSTATGGTTFTTPAFVINQSGNVGIGTTNPGYKFVSITSTANDQAVRGNITATTGTNYGGVFVANGSGPTENSAGYFYATGATTNRGVYINGPPAAANSWALYSDATAQSYFAGNVGIGTTSPAAKLHVGGDNARQLSIDKSTVAVTAPGAGVGMLRWEAGTNAGTLKLVAYAGTSTTGTTVVDNVGAGN